MAIARKEVIRGEPEVENYDGWHSSNGPLSNPRATSSAGASTRDTPGKSWLPSVTLSRHEPLGSL